MNKPASFIVALLFCIGLLMQPTESQVRKDGVMPSDFGTQQVLGSCFDSGNSCVEVYPNNQDVRNTASPTWVSPTATTSFSLGAAGVIFTHNSDGAWTMCGNGDGSDECLTIGLDAISNVPTLSSSTGVTIFSWSGVGLATNSSLTSSGAAAGVGYSTGAGCAVTQMTNKSTGVTCTGMTGEITMNGAALAANTTVSFTLTNTSLAALDQVNCNHDSAGTGGAYTCTIQSGAGTATVFVRNVTAGSLSEAIVLKFAATRAVVS